MTIQELRLVHVIWGDDEALISLAVPAVLVATYEAREFHVPPDVPKVWLTDEDMDIFVGKGDGAACWDDVPAYLAHLRSQGKALSS